MPEILGKQIGPIGYGLMGLSWRPQPQDIEKSIEAMKAALEAGANFWNGGEFYGTPEYNSMTILEKYFEKYPEDADKVVLSIKGATGVDGFHPDSSAKEIRRSMDAVIKQLKGRKKVDLFECARRDGKTPLEETFSTLQKEYIDRGLLGGISLSEVSADTIRDAVKIAKIAAIEVELSLWSMDILSNDVAKVAAQHSIPIIAYSPIGRGMLSGEITSLDDIPQNDMRRRYPRFQPETFPVNLKLVKQVQQLAKKRDLTPAQLAINWTRALSKRPGMPLIIPIPGATTVARVKENSKVVDLSEEDLKEIDETLAQFEVKGTRYPAGHPIEG